MGNNKNDTRELTSFDNYFYFGLCFWKHFACTRKIFFFLSRMGHKPEQAKKRSHVKLDQVLRSNLDNPTVD